MHLPPHNKEDQLRCIKMPPSDSLYPTQTRIQCQGNYVSKNQSSDNIHEVMGVEIHPPKSA